MMALRALADMQAVRAAGFLALSKFIEQFGRMLEGYPHERNRAFVSAVPGSSTGWQLTCIATTSCAVSLLLDVVHHDAF
jgi:hypothetical protein